MKPPRDILKHVSVETVERKRKCHRKEGHSISAGERCIVIKEGSFSGSKNYCLTCAQDILTAAGNKMESLNEELKKSSNHQTA